MNKIEITKEQKTKAINELIHYFKKERDEEIGILAAEMILDFMIKKIGPIIYNQAIADAHKYMSEKTEDLFCLWI